MTDIAQKRVRNRSYSGPHFSRVFPHSDWIRRDTSIRMRENPGKMRTRITPNTNSFYAVRYLSYNYIIRHVEELLLPFCLLTRLISRLISMLKLSFCFFYHCKLFKASLNFSLTFKICCWGFNFDFYNRCSILFP